MVHMLLIEVAEVHFIIIFFVKSHEAILYDVVFLQHIECIDMIAYRDIP